MTNAYSWGNDHIRDPQHQMQKRAASATHLAEVSRVDELRSHEGLLRSRHLDLTRSECLSDTIFPLLATKGIVNTPHLKHRPLPRLLLTLCPEIINNLRCHESE